MKIANHNSIEDKTRSNTRTNRLTQPLTKYLPSPFHNQERIPHQNKIAYYISATLLLPCLIIIAIMCAMTASNTIISETKNMCAQIILSSILIVVLVTHAILLPYIISTHRLNNDQNSSQQLFNYEPKLIDSANIPKTDEYNEVFKGLLELTDCHSNSAALHNAITETLSIDKTTCHAKITLNTINILNNRRTKVPKKPQQLRKPLIFLPKPQLKVVTILI